MFFSDALLPRDEYLSWLQKLKMRFFTHVVEQLLYGQRKKGNSSVHTALEHPAHIHVCQLLAEVVL